MKRISLLSILALALALPAAFAQQGQPSQPPDPTAQSPATQAPTTPPTFPDTQSKPDRSPEAQSQQSSEAGPSSEASQGLRIFSGTIGQGQDGYVLRAGHKEYKLDDQSKAKQYDGKHVQVQGHLNADTNTIHVQKIEAAPSM
jgi:Protein of unknown function (DUF5818)